MIKLLLAAGTVAAATLAVPAAAQSFGSSALGTMRSCSATAATALCDGTGPDQLIVTRSNTGGANAISNTDLTLANGSYARGTTAFGAFDLPELRGESRSLGDDRLNINMLAFQTYLYTGPSGTPFSLSGDLHIVDSSNNATDGALPGGAIYSQYLAIWDTSILGGLTSADDIFNNFFYASCGTPGVLAAASGGGSLPGGETSFSLTTTSCSGLPLLLTTGQTVLAVAGMQLPVNRGGFADSTGTFLTRFGDDLTPEQIATIQTSVVSGIVMYNATIPEPASWALLVAGFGLVGGALRRSRPAVTAA